MSDPFESGHPDEEIELAREILEVGPGRFLELPERDSQDDYALMEEFIGTVADPRLQDRLARAISGKGAFRYFRDTLDESPKERDRWYVFRERRRVGVLLDVLEAHAIEPTNPPPKPEDHLDRDDHPAKDRDDLLEEITLLALYLSSWKEGDALRAWKGHRFEILDELERHGLVDLGRRGTKSLFLTDGGEEKAKKLERRFRDRG